MVSEEAGPLIIDIAKSFITLVMEVEPKWNKAYLRFCAQGAVSEAKGSYVHKAGVEILDAQMHKNFFLPVARKGRDLLAALGKTEGIFLLYADSNFDYEIKFEYQNFERWEITKANGSTGIPEGV